MAEALVSSVLHQLSLTIWKAEQRVKLVTCVKEEVEKLKRNFEAIQDVLEDAEEKQIVEKNVSRWLDQLKDVSFDMEDVLDEWNTSLLKLRSKIDEVERSSFAKRMVCPFIPCFSFGHHVVKRHDIAIKIEGINKKLDEIAREKDRYQLTKREIRKLPRRIESTSVVDESKLLGRDGIKKEIVSRLLYGSNDEGRGIPTISLIGMGGIGKTSLAKMVYNDGEVQRHFGKLVWVCVSDLFDLSKIARHILEGLDPNPTNFQNAISLNSLLGKIREKITTAKVFLVLDDVWEDHYESWEELKDTFHHCMAGSRILVTTRKHSVVKVMESSHVFLLKQLSNETCWAILRRVAFLGRDLRDHEDLEDIGMKIAQKCKGLPLAAKTLGSLLREKESKAEWECVLNSEIWRLDIAQEYIFTPLMLSYYDLPSAIRRCLLYCAVFPQDYEMHKNELILHWKLQGYLNFDEIDRRKGDFDEDLEMEVKGEGYFTYLAGRSFFQDFQKDSHGVMYGCKMHDVIHDFVQFMTKEEIVAEEVNSSEIWGLDLSSNRARHLRITIKKWKRFPLLVNGVGKLRSLVATGRMYDVSCEVLQDLFGKAKCLRLLDFGFMGSHGAAVVKEIPEDVGKLIHLRYLSLGYSYGLRKLPEAICELQNLQYLNLMCCESLEELPSEIEKLIKLKYLYTHGCDELTYYPKGIGKLCGLRGLDRVIAKIDSNDNRIFCVGDLENLDLLSGHLQLHIRGKSVHSWEEEAKRAKLHNKIHLTELEMSLKMGGRWAEQEVKNKVIQALNPPSNLHVEWS